MDKFDLSPLGFLPIDNIFKLPTKFIFFQEIIENLPESKNSNSPNTSFNKDELISENNFYKCINQLPQYDPELHSIDDLTDKEKKYMYSILCMIMNRYVWGNGVNKAKEYSDIPQIIGLPLFQISEHFDIAIGITHAAIDLWNWELDGDKFSLDNIRIKHSLTGNVSEEWFYKVMIAIEGNGGTLLKDIFNISRNQEMCTVNELTYFLMQLEKNIGESVKIMGRMYEHCDPEFFFNNIRIYLSGSKNDHLPNGLNIDGNIIGQGIIKLNYIGGSAAQSTLMQVYDKLFGIEHGKTQNFFNEMRRFMPGKHRDFLEQIKPIKDLIALLDNTGLTNEYNKCLNQIEKLRKVHLGLVQNYIMKFVKMEHNDKNAHGDKGSGGTTPIEFCQKIIDETRETKIVNCPVDKPPSFNKDESQYFSNTFSDNTSYANLLWLIVPGCCLLYLFMQKY